MQREFYVEEHSILLDENKKTFATNVLLSDKIGSPSLTKSFHKENCSILSLLENNIPEAVWETVENYGSWEGAVIDDGTLHRYWISIQQLISKNKRKLYLVRAGIEKGGTPHITKGETYPNLPYQISDRTTLMFLLKQRIKKKLSSDTFVLIIVNFDRFRTLKDGNGSFSGKQVLIQTIRLLFALLTEEDFFFKTRNNEFALFVPLKKPERLSSLIKGIKKIFSQPIIVDNETFEISTHIGASLFPQNAASAEQLMRCADMALHQARQNKISNDVIFYNNNIEEEVKKVLRLEKDLYRALERKELFLQYQPQIDIKTSNVIGVEALLRWHRGYKEVIFPNDFIPMAETSLVMIDIGRWVLQEAFVQAKKWIKQGIQLNISVNISPVQIYQDRHLKEEIEKLLRFTSIPASMLTLEITEKTLRDRHGLFEKVMGEIRSHGVKIYLDDFGKGYSSIDFVKSFPFDGIKIDREIITNAPRSAREKTFANSFIRMAHSLVQHIVIEGVETNEQINSLDLGLSNLSIQGYYYSPPLDAEKIAPFILTKRNSLHLEAVGRSSIQRYDPKDIGPV